MNNEKLVEYYDGLFVTPFHYMVFRDGLCGLRDTDGTMLLPTEYDKIIACQIGLNAEYDRVHRYYLRYDEDYRLFIAADLHEYRADWSTYGQNYVYVCQFKGRYGIIDKDFSLIVPFDFEDIEPLFLDYYSNDSFCCAVKKNGKWGLFSRGRLSIPCIFDGLSSRYYDQSYYTVKQGNKEGIVDKDGNTIVPFEYDWVRKEKCGFVVELNRKQGLFSFNGHPAIPCLFDKIHPISENRVWVEQNKTKSKWIKKDEWTPYDNG